jgi:hypothetical protein
MTMTDEDITVEDIKRMALGMGPGAMVEMLAEGDPVTQHLALSTQVYQQSRELVRCAAILAGSSDLPEHAELAKAMLDAVKGAKVAFDAAANAAYQLFWLSNHCDCDECVNDRRRDAAPNN